jgi:ubiquinone biosynthesis protein
MMFDHEALSSNLKPEEWQLVARACLGSSRRDRIRLFAKVLRGADGRSWRDKIGLFVSQILPVETLVPEAYRQWRPLVRDAMRLVFSHLSPSRLAPKVVEQIELPPDTPPQVRLLRLIVMMPGLQKLGQVLARNRHLDPCLREQLSKLENGITGANAGEIRSIILKQLGPVLDTHAVELDSVIFSEASVSAVMRFTWWNGDAKRRERGVFKVLKPYVPRCLAEDMALLRQVAEFVASHAGEYWFAARQLPDMVAEVCRLLEREVDLPREQANLKDACRFYSAIPGVVIPRVIEPLCTTGITAMTEETGAKITDVFAEQPRLRRRVAEQLVEALISVPLFSQEEAALFHADPHAGNLLYNERTGKLVILDWALTERLNREQRRSIVLLTILLGLRDTAGVASMTKALTCRDTELGQWESRLIDDSVARFIDALPAAQVPGSMEVMQLFDQLALNGVRFPAAMLMFRKARFTLDGVLHDIAGPIVRVDENAFSYFVNRWLTSAGNAYEPLFLSDGILLQMSALCYPGRLWMRATNDAPGSTYWVHL